MTTRKYALAAGKDFLDPNTKRGSLTAAELIERLREFHIISLTQAEYAALPAREKATWKKESGYLIGGEFGGKKKASDCQFRSIVTLDLDALTPESTTNCIETLRGLKVHAVIYSTASHRSTAPRLRAFIFLKEDVPPSLYRNLVRFFAALLPSGAVSNESYVVSQIMYRPQRCTDGDALFIELPGEPFDASTVPDQSPEIADRPSTSQKAWEIPGIVGRVGKRYEGDFDTAIAELGLPYLRSTSGATCGEFEDRYTYTAGHGADGAVWYRDDGHLFSHHGTDPCGGENATIFDVYRLHNCRPELDDVTLPISERASHRAAEAFFMQKFPELAQLAVGDDEMEVLPDEPPKPANPKRFKVVRPEDFAEGPPLEWLIDTILPQAELGVVYGASGSGKSFFVFDLVTAICRGANWRGLEAIKSGVVYVAAEAARGFRKRMKAYSNHHEVPMSVLPGIIADAPNLLEATDVRDLIAAIKEYGFPKVVVIDTLAAVMPGGNENESAAMTRLVSHCKAITAATGAMVILIHHSGKDASKGARGHSSLRAASDVEIEITRGDGTWRIATLSKSKDDVDGKQFAFRLPVVNVGEDQRGRVITSCVVEAGDMPERTVKKKPLTKEMEPVFKLIKRLIESGKRDRAEILLAVALEIPMDKPNATIDDKRSKGRIYITRLVNYGWLFAGKLLDGRHALDLVPFPDSEVVSEEEEF